MPQPLLSLGYLLALRGGAVTPSFVPLLVLAAFPVASMILAARSLRRHAALALVAVLELVSSALAAAMVGFAIALHSG